MPSRPYIDFMTVGKDEGRVSRPGLLRLAARGAATGVTNRKGAARVIRSYGWLQMAVANVFIAPETVLGRVRLASVGVRLGSERGGGRIDSSHGHYRKESRIKPSGWDDTR